MEDEKSGKFWESRLVDDNQVKVVDLIGRKCLVDCYVDGLRVDAWWDTASMVTIVSKKWVIEYFPENKLCNIGDLLDGGDLKLRAANGGNIDYCGWISLRFRLYTESGEGKELIVPTLVAKDGFDRPLIGYNVVKEVMNDGESEVHIKAALKNVASNHLTEVVEVLQSPDNIRQSTVKVKNNMTIQNGHCMRIDCRINTQLNKSKTPMLFEPTDTFQLPEGLVLSEKLITIPGGHCSRIKVDVENTSGHPIMLSNNTCLGQIQQVRSITPVDVKLKQNLT